MKTWACLKQCVRNHWVLCQCVYLGRPPSLPLEEPNSLSTIRILLWMFLKEREKNKKKNTKNNTHKKTPPWSRSFIINRVGAWKGICFDLVTKTKTKRLSLIAWMTQVGPSVKSNKSLLPSELYANTGPWAPACSSSRPHAMSLSLRKPG